ncbi:MAG: N-acetylmuramoyl-L-alanine amidase [Prevotella sp.]|jgi:N-acetylmuramoyl-L-alanine amidase|nr:N-acetylmuramoyl-L-alanine amidase [Prevotella sp.]
MKKSLSFVLLLFFAYGILSAANSKFVVVIDAGHGGKDSGAIRGDYREKDINLAVALGLGQLIEKNYNDVEVVYTRKTDVFVDLNKRADIANKAKANLFISIHTNSTLAKTTTVAGTDVYILGLARSEENLEVAKRENSVILLEDDYSTKYEGFDPNSPESSIIFEFMTNKFMEQSLEFASFVQSDMKDVAGRVDRGVFQAGFLVLRKISAPSVLIELGFVSNPDEARFLYSKAGQQSMAVAIYSGFKKYKRNFDKKQGKLVIDANDKNNKNDSLAVIKDKKDKAVAASKTPAIPAVTDAKDGQIEYRVQFYISPNILPDNSPAFKGLSPVSYYKDGNNYKYTYGSTTDMGQIAKTLKDVRLEFKDAFIVKFKDGKRVIN